MAALLRDTGQRHHKLPYICLAAKVPRPPSWWLTKSIVVDWGHYTLESVMVKVSAAHNLLFPLIHFPLSLIIASPTNEIVCLESSRKSSLKSSIVVLIPNISSKLDVSTQDV